MEQLKSIILFFSSFDNNETFTSYRVVGLVYDMAVYDYLKLFNEEISKLNLGNLNIVDEFGSEVFISIEYDATSANNNIRVTLTKNVSFPFFLTENGFINYLLDENALTTVDKIRMLNIDRAFSSVKVTFVPFNTIETQSVTLEDSLNSIDYVKPLNEGAQKFLSRDLLRWITVKVELENSCDSWKMSSTKRLIPSLCSEFSLNDEVLDMIFLSQRRKNISVSLIENEVFLCTSGIIHDIARWIYLENKDVSAKHIIFNNQISQQILDENKDLDPDTFAHILKNSLTNSMLAYRFHLIDSNKELSKILTDLNKTIFDYTDRIRKNAAELINLLWRDFTTVLGILILRFVVKDSKTDLDYYTYIGCALIFYLIISLILNSRIAFWYYRKLILSLTNDKNKIYPYLTAEEYKEYAITPINDTQKKYRQTFIVIAIAYAITIYYIVYTIYTNN